MRLRSNCVRCIETVGGVAVGVVQNLRRGRLGRYAAQLTLSRQLFAIERADPYAIAVVEAALLIEAGFDKKLEYLVVTWCTPEQQLARLTAPGTGRGLTIEQAQQRIAAQMPIDEKRRRANAVIDCSGTLEHTRAQVIALFAKLKGMQGAK